MIDDNFDFGFTLESDEEVKRTLPIEGDLKTQLEEMEKQNKKMFIERNRAVNGINSLHSSIKPFLNNLKANPEKDYIYWAGSDRISRIEEFERHLEEIVNNAIGQTSNT